MGVFDRCVAHRCPADMGDHCLGIYPRCCFAEVLAIKSCPSLLFDQRKAVAVIRRSPAMAVMQSFPVPAALLHQGVLRVNQTAFDARWFVGTHGVEAAHAMALRASNTC